MYVIGIRWEESRKVLLLTGDDLNCSFVNDVRL